MAKSKLKHFKEMDTFSNVFQLNKTLRGKWNTEVFKNNNPITLELACGQGEYTVALAQQHIHRNFIGVDVKGARIYRGAKKSLELQLHNAAFLRGQIDHIAEYFDANEVSEIWILFPDPFLSIPKQKKRLTSPQFLHRYKQILKPMSLLHLKTDSKVLYDYTMEILQKENLTIEFATEDLYANQLPDEVLATKTYYENANISRAETMKYIRWRM